MLQQDSTHPTGISDDTPRGNSDVNRARNRKANAALELRKAGATWDEVAEVLGFPTARSALVAVERALEQGLGTQESQEFMRKMAGDRLERMIRAVWAKAIDPENPEQMAAQDRARASISDFRKLYGLDAPTQMVVNSPTQVQLEKWVATVVSAGTPQLEEPDIFDIVEGESSESEPEADDAVQAE